MVCVPPPNSSRGSSCLFLWFGAHHKGPHSSKKNKTKILDIIGWSSLPDGLLPKWLWFIGLVSVLNNVQAFSSLSDVRRLYSNKPHEVTPLSQRTFALWTFLSSVVRFYGAYHIHVGPIYLIVLWSFVIAWIHFVSEILIFKASRFEGPIIAPCIITTATVAWMIVQSENYIKYAN